MSSVRYNFFAVAQSKIRKEENAGSYMGHLSIWYYLFPPLQHSKRTPLPPFTSLASQKPLWEEKENLFAALAKCRLKIPLVLILQTFLSW
jgi:hypothetical protein